MTGHSKAHKCKPMNMHKMKTYDSMWGDKE